jgi:hypothetical protein
MYLRFFPGLSDSFIAIEPSFPNLGFFARFFDAAPDIYCLKRANLTSHIKNSYSFKIEGSAITDQYIIIEGPGTKYITLVCA